MIKYKFSELFNYLPKSKIKAGEGKRKGMYPLFTSSPKLTKYFDKYIYEGESLIFGTGGLPSVHYINDKFSTSTDCLIVQKKKEYENKVDAGYVYYFFKGNSRILEDGFHGAGLKHISKKYISNIKIPLPEKIDDQIKIANLLTQVESLIAKREESIKLLDELLRSTFLDMFGDPVLNSKGWNVEVLKKFGKISTGNTPSRREDKYYDSEYIEWIKTDNIKTDKVYLTKAKEYLSEKGLEKGRSVNAGSLLVTCIAGSLKSIGNASLTDRKVAFNQQINAIEPFEDVNSLFLYWLVKISKKYIQNQAGKGMKKMITKSSFQKITFPKPPKPLQDKFATIVKQVEETKKKYNKSLDGLQQLFGSLSQRAFKGELDLSGVETPITVNRPDVKVLNAPSSSGAGDIVIENQEIEHIKGRAKSGAGDLEEIIDTPFFRKEQRESIFIGKEYSDCNDEFLLNLIALNNNVTFEELINSIKEFPFKKLPTYTELKKDIFSLIEEKKLEQHFDDNRKIVILRKAT